MRKWYTKIKTYYNWGKRFLNDPYHTCAKEKTKKEFQKTPSRTAVINYLLSSFGDRATTYLEIGVRNPADNFNHINAKKKYSVDPGIEFKENPVDFKITSDDFFHQLRTGKILSPEIRFDVIFIDGLHLAEQAEKDIQNALDFLKEDGFIVLHDCNPPTEWHAREIHDYQISPAMNQWNGTTWKAFLKARQNKRLFSCCVDTDWGVGIISKHVNIGEATTKENPFFEFKTMDRERKESLNLISFQDLKELLTLKSI